MNCRCHQTVLQVERFYTDRERCELLNAFSLFWRRPGGDWANTLTLDDEMF
jgi:hypothetical protein